MRDVEFALGQLAKRLSTRSVRLARMILIQAIRNAMVTDLVVRNVADLAAVATGEPGRPSRSLNLEQARAVLDAAKGERLWPYVAVSMLSGIRTEEARALRSVVYRHQLRSVTRTAAIGLGPLFESGAKTDGGQS